jgi:hypothetical protein
MRVHGRIAVAALVLLGVAAPDAGATLRTVNHNDPAGDPTAITYRISGAPAFPAPVDFQLTDGDYRSFGPAAGTYTVQALVPQGWQVGDIQCVGPPERNDFAIDIPNGRVTVTHGPTDEHTCSFTNRRIPPGGSAPSSPGIAPAPPASELPKVGLPRKAALVGVVAGRRYAEATVRIMRRSTIKGRLLSPTGKTRGNARIRRDAGTHVLRVAVKRERVRRMRKRGKRQVLLTLRLAVVDADNGATRVFHHRVMVRL